MREARKAKARPLILSTNPTQLQTQSLSPSVENSMASCSGCRRSALTRLDTKRRWARGFRLQPCTTKCEVNGLKRPSCVLGKGRKQKLATLLLSCLLNDREKRSNLFFLLFFKATIDCCELVIVRAWPQRDEQKSHKINCFLKNRPADWLQILDRV